MIVATRAERRRLAEELVLAHPDRSIRWLSAMSGGLCREMIAGVRDELVAAGRLPQPGRVVGGDGKAYPVRVPSGGPRSTLGRQVVILDRLVGRLERGPASWHTASPEARQAIEDAAGRLQSTLERLRRMAAILERRNKCQSQQHAAS